MRQAGALGCRVTGPMRVHPEITVSVTLGDMWIVASAFPLAVLGMLTAMGAHRRGVGIVRTAIAGVCFPFTWAVWYVRDEHPYRHERS